MKTCEYTQPHVEFIDIDNEGILCDSAADSGTEQLREINGSW